MTTDENATPTPTRAQAEKAASAMLDVTNARENLATRLKVAQYATWRARFDGMRGSRASAGIANAKLFRGSEDTLVVLADIPGFRDALAWAEGGWKTAIPADEVEGPPVVYFGVERAGRPTIVDMGSAPGRPICAPSRTTTMRAWRFRSTIRPTAQAWNTIARSSSGSRR
jgi:hypothetical protein